MRSATWGWIAAFAALATAAWTPTAQAAKPDLVVRAVDVAPATVAAGRTVTVTDTTANDGRKGAGPSWTGYTLVSRKAKIALGVRRVPALAGGEASRGAVALIVPATTRDGAYALIACADVRRDVRESREDGNCRIARRRLVVDSVAPVAPTLDERPDAATNRTNVRIAFSHPERGVTFACRADAGAEDACRSPYDSAELAEGPHRFEVRAIDAAGNRGAVAAVDWTV